MFSTASVPLAACPTTSKPDSSSIWTSILRTWAVSSTTKTRTDMQGSYTAPAVPPRLGALRIERPQPFEHRDEEGRGSPEGVGGRRGSGHLDGRSRCRRGRAGAGCRRRGGRLHGRLGGGRWSGRLGRRRRGGLGLRHG